MARILILSFSKIGNDPRVMRQVHLLKKVHKLTVVGFGPSPDDNILYKEVASVPTSKLRKIYMAILLMIMSARSFYWKQRVIVAANNIISEQSFDLIIANDITALPLSLAKKGTASVLFDAHEYSPREIEDQILKHLLLGPFINNLCKEYLPYVDGAITVCNSIAEEYRKNYGIQMMVVRNCGPFQKLSPSKVKENRIRLIHHGIAARSRKLECMIEMMKYLDQRFSLDLMLMPSSDRYINALRRKARGDSRIRFVEPVSMDEICRSTNSYDLGLFLLPPTNFNYQQALPNKIFEYIQARLGIAVGPSPEMAALVRQYGCGVVAESYRPKDLAKRLNSLNIQDVAAFKAAADKAAHELCFEQESQVLLDTIDRLLHTKTKIK